MTNILPEPVQSCTYVLCTARKKKKSSPRTKHRADPEHRLEYKLRTNRPHFTGVRAVDQISTLAELFRLGGMEKPPADLRLQNPNGTRGAPGGEAETKSTPSLRSNCDLPWDTHRQGPL